MSARVILALLAGTIFGAGLTVGGMTDPARVRGFLAIFGQWDPTLAFVMGGAVMVMARAWLLQRRMARPLLAGKFHLPDRSDLTARLLTGSALFGVGWGLAGLCPGPGIASLALAPVQAVIFCASMAAGIFFQRVAFGNRATAREG